MQMEYLSCDESDPGLLQTSGLSIGFANGHHKYIYCCVQCMFLWVWLQFELVCDETVVMMPPSFSHYSFEGED